MVVTRKKRTPIANNVIDLDIVFVDPGKEKPKPKRTRKAAPSTSTVKKTVTSTTTTPKKVVKRQPVTRKKAAKVNTPKEKIPKEKAHNEKAPNVKAEKSTKSKSKKNSGIVIPEGLDIPNDMKGRILRAAREKLYIISRERFGNQEEYQVSGSTGNLYKVIIGPRLSCSCRDYIYRRMHCKHLLSVLLKAFRLPITSPMFINLTPSVRVLQEVFQNCIPDPSSFVPQELKPLVSKRINGETETDTNIKAQRRPLDTSDCPVCCEEFETGKINETIYCRTCGNNIHELCFNMWKATRGDYVTCVFCRAPWEPIRRKKEKKNLNVEGYVNIGEALGLPEKRDIQTYGRIFGDINEELSKSINENVDERPSNIDEDE